MTNGGSRFAPSFLLVSGVRFQVSRMFFRNLHTGHLTPLIKLGQIGTVSLTISLDARGQGRC
jgi:hypothetical protein